MKIKVTKCSNQFLWYFRHIGKIFEVVNVESTLHWVREPDEWKCLNFIFEDDIVIVEN